MPRCDGIGMSEAQPRPRNALVALDLLRFAAAMMVLVYHYWGEWLGRFDRELQRTLADQLTSSNAWLHVGWIGVEIFFLISGYVIAMSARSVDAATFARKRWLRLWPAALVCSSITALALWAWGFPMAELWRRWVASAFLIPVKGQIDIVYWTLRIECAFYLLVALMLWLRCWRPVPFAVGLSLWSLAYWAGAAGLTGLGKLDLGETFAELSLGRYGAFFALGILIEAAHRRDPLFKRWMIAPPLIAAPLCINWHSATFRPETAPPSLELEPHLMFVVSLAVVAMAPAIQQRVRSAALARIAVALGLATYPFYLLHNYVGQTIMLTAVDYGVPKTVIVWPVAAAMIGLALIVASYIEPPIRLWFGELLDRRRPGLSPATA